MDSNRSCAEARSGQPEARKVPGGALEPLDVLLDAAERLIDDVLELGEGREQGRLQLRKDFLDDEFATCLDAVVVRPVAHQSRQLPRIRGREFDLGLARAANEIG